MRVLLSCLFALSLVSCRSGPTIVPGPAVRPTFAPPAGFVQQERYRQRRSARIELEDADTQLVLDEVAGLSEEKYEPLANGDFRVTSVLVSENATRNGLKVRNGLDMTGIALTHIVDAQGKFVRAEKIDDTISTMLGRVEDANGRDALRAVLTPSALEQRLRRAWEARFANVCGRDLSPGDRFVVLDQQEIPFAGAVRGLLREVVTGTTGDVVSLRLFLSGRSSPDVDAAQAEGLFAELPGGMTALTDSLDGEGERYVSPRTCQTVRERMHLSGEIRLNREAAQASGMTGFPTKITYDVDRDVWRSPPGAPALPNPGP